MKKFFKILPVILISFFIVANFVLAVTPLTYQPLVSLDLKGGASTEMKATGYIKMFLTAFMAVIVAMSIFQIVKGGIKRMFGGDSAGMKSEGKTDIMEAVKGLILALLTYMILTLVNPKLIPGADLFNFDLKEPPKTN